MNIPTPVYVEAPAAVLALAMAAVVLVKGPGRTTNRRLAALLAFEGFTQAFSAVGILGRANDLDALGAAAATTFVVALVGLTLSYFAFLATLDSPLVRLLRWRGTTPVLVALGVVLAAWIVVAPAPAWLPGEAVGGPALLAVLAVFAFASLFGLAVAASSWRRAPRATLVRRRASAYLAAFGLRDLMFVTFLVPLLVALGFGVVPAEFEAWLNARATGRAYLAWLQVVTGTATLAFVLLMAYGALRTRLLDLDLRIKVTIRQSTVAAVFVAVFVVVAAVVEQWAGSRGVLWGGLAAAALVFALHPIQRMASRVADVAMPGVKPPTEMTGDERLHVYRDQVETAWADGSLTRDERVLLERLRERLGIGTDEANRIEREVTGA